MTSPGEPSTEPSRPSIRRYIPATIVTPLIGVSLGVDGGAIFQILAIENLGLSATAIGIAFGLGVASLPIQIYAARIPIQRARRNMQIFFVFAAVQAWLLALLVGFGATGGYAAQRRMTWSAAWGIADHVPAFRDTSGVPTRLGERRRRSGSAVGRHPFRAHSLRTKRVLVCGVGVRRRSRGR